MSINSRDLADEILNDFFGGDFVKNMSEEDRKTILQTAGIPDGDVNMSDPEALNQSSLDKLRELNLSMQSNQLNRLDQLMSDYFSSTMDLRSKIGGNQNPSGSKSDDGNVPSDIVPPSGVLPPVGNVPPSSNVPPTGNVPSSASDQNTEQAKEEKQEAEKAAEPETDPMEDLQKLVGMDDLKKDVDELINLMKLQKLRESRGMKTVAISKHLVFSGNPGTGKTTVARILARLYKQIGVLSKGQLVEVDRSGLVAGYVGQTAMKTQDKIKEAMGGILFVDEAYTLAKEGADYGQEAIDTILKAMEDNRDDFVVIVAGYPDLMHHFIDSNPGLKSRFNKYFYFNDYSAEELETIFYGFCKKNDYTVADDAKDAITAHMQDMIAGKDENFANARDVRNYFEHIVNKQATRIIQIENPTDEEVCMITLSDLGMDEEEAIEAEITSHYNTTEE